MRRHLAETSRKWNGRDARWVVGDVLTGVPLPRRCPAVARERQPKRAR